MHADRIGDQLAEIASGIRNNVPDSEGRLFAVLGGGIRTLLSRRVRRDAADIDHSVQECVQALVSAIRSGALREPGAIVSYALTLTRQQAAGLTDGAQQTKSSQQSENVDLFHRALLRLSRSDRELLRRFYSHTESDQEIRQSLGLTETQFRLKLSHAKRKLTEEVQHLKRRRGAGKLLEWFTDRRKDS